MREIIRQAQEERERRIREHRPYSRSAAETTAHEARMAAYESARVEAEARRWRAEADVIILDFEKRLYEEVLEGSSRRRASDSHSVFVMRLHGRVRSLAELTKAEVLVYQYLEANGMGQCCDIRADCSGNNSSYDFMYLKW